MGNALNLTEQEKIRISKINTIEADLGTLEGLVNHLNHLESNCREISIHTQRMFTDDILYLKDLR